MTAKVHAGARTRHVPGRWLMATRGDNQDSPYDDFLSAGGGDFNPEGEFFDPDAPAPAPEKTVRKHSATRIPGVGSQEPLRTITGPHDAVPVRKKEDEDLLLESAIVSADSETPGNDTAPEGPRFYRDPEILAEEVGDRREPVATVLAASLTAVLLTLAVLAWMNDGVIDFNNTSGFLAPTVDRFAEPTIPTVTRTILEVSGIEDEAPDLRAGPLSIGVVRTANAPALLVIESTVQHHGGPTVRRLNVEVTARIRGGEEIGRIIVPAGGVLVDEEIDVITSHEDRDQRIQSLARRAASLELTEGQRTPFGAVFVLPSPIRPDRIEASAEITGMHVRTSPMCWTAAGDDLLAEVTGDSIEDWEDLDADSPNSEGGESPE